MGLIGPAGRFVFGIFLMLLCSEHSWAQANAQRIIPITQTAVHNDAAAFWVGQAGGASTCNAGGATVANATVTITPGGNQTVHLTDLVIQYSTTGTATAAVPTISITGVSSGGAPPFLNAIMSANAVGQHADFVIPFPQGGLMGSDPGIPVVIAPSAALGTNNILCMSAAGFFNVPGAVDPTIGILPTERDSWPNWKMAGLLSIGGIPTRNTQCGAMVNPRGSGLDDTANIQAAINAAASPCNFINLSSGIFTIAEGNKILINQSVTLRGQGAGVTFLQHPPGEDYQGCGYISGTVLTMVSTNFGQLPITNGLTIQGNGNLFCSGGGGSVSNGTTVSGCSGSTCTVSISQTTGSAGTPVGISVVPGAWGATFKSQNPGNNASAIVRIGGGVGFGSPISLASDTTVGSYSVQVTNASGILVGSLVNLDEIGNSAAQPSPDWITSSGGAANQIWAQADYSTEWNAHNPTVGSFDSACFDNSNFTNGGNCAAGGNHQDAIAYSIRGGGIMEEEHLVIGVSGTTIVFDSPVMRVYHVANSAALTVFTASNEVQQAGLENLTVQYGDADNIDIQGCIYCWISGVESTLYLNPGIHFQQGAFRNQLTNSWAHEGAWPVNGGAGYNIALTYGTSEDLIDNNISMKANKCIVMRASGAGTVVAYNYMDDQYIGGNSSWVETCLNNSHLGGPGHTLFEGNWSSNIDSDYTHGAVSYGTYFRNNITGIRAAWTSAFDGFTRDDTTGCCSPLRAASSHPYTYWTSFVGNILGTAGVTTNANGWDYQNNAFTSKHLLMLGWNDLNVGGANLSGPDNTANVIYPGDPRTVCGTTGRCASSPGCMLSTNCTTIVDMNYDYVNNKQTCDSRGCVVLPSSFYLTTAPAYFAGLTWPPIDPSTPTAKTVPAHGRWISCQPTPTAACLTAH